LRLSSLVDQVIQDNPHERTAVNPGSVNKSHVDECNYLGRNAGNPSALLFAVFRLVLAPKLPKRQESKDKWAATAFSPSFAPSGRTRRRRLVVSAKLAYKISMRVSPGKAVAASPQAKLF
jgi:hypothetical protein